MQLLRFFQGEKRSISRIVFVIASFISLLFTIGNYFEMQTDLFILCFCCERYTPLPSRTYDVNFVEKRKDIEYLGLIEQNFRVYTRVTFRDLFVNVIV